MTTTTTDTTILNILTEVWANDKELLTREPVATGGETAGEKVEDDTPAKPTVELDLKPIVRPNGEEYFPRKLPEDPFGAMTDVVFLQQAYEARMPCLLFGHPGTGKTAMLEAALPGLVTMVGTAETEIADFLGSWVQNTEGNYEWVDGPLPQALMGGHPFFIDEIAQIDPRVLGVVYSLMDGRAEIKVTANPARGSIKAEDGFMVFGACNPNVPGAIMSDALLSRFQVHIEVKTDWDLARKLGAPIKIIVVAKNLQSRADEGSVVAPPQLREVLTYRDVEKLYGTDVAAANFIAQARPEDRSAFSDAIEGVFKADRTSPLTFG